MQFDKMGENCNGLIPLIFGLMRVNSCRIQDFAGGIDNGDFHAGTDAGVQAHGCLRSGGCCQQQILQIFRKDTDGFFL